MFSRLRVESSRTSGWIFDADTETDGLFSGGVSDHVRGRGLGRASGHFAWSLTPRDCRGRPHGQWRHNSGGTKRRPTTITCNLRGESRLSSELAARESPAATWRIPSTLCRRGGTPRATALFPPLFPPSRAFTSRNLRHGCAGCATVNHSQTAPDHSPFFDGGLRHRYRGVEQPPGRPRDRTGRKIGGLLTPPLLGAVV